MLTHCAPRMIARAALRFRQFELDERVIGRSAAVLTRALEGGRQLTRPAIYARLERAGIAAGNSRGLHILWRLAHDGLICFGAREGKQHTFALLDEWVPRGRTLERDEALAELARRYFTSHGPATLKDFTWWSGLAAADARRAVEAAGTDAAHLAAGTAAPRTAAPRTSHHPHAVLLPPYDEYTVAYQDRSAALDPAHVAKARYGILGPTIVIDGRIVGTWTRTETPATVSVSTRLFRRLSPPAKRALAAAITRYRAFKRPA
jgi:hypothetical protein